MESTPRRENTALPEVSGQDTPTGNFVPATGWSIFLPWYDLAVAQLTGEQKFKQHLLDQAILHTAEQAPCHLVDVGCGSGTLAIAVAAAVQPGMSVSAIDVDPRMIAQAKDKPGAESVQWLSGNAVDLPLPADSADMLFCSLLFHHLLPEDKRAAAMEFRRILKPGGTVLLADYAEPKNWLARLRFLPVRLVDGFRQTHCNLIGRLPDVLSEAGLANICQTLAIETPLGTLRCYRCEKV